jgi:hypothetical protein
LPTVGQAPTEAGAIEREDGEEHSRSYGTAIAGAASLSLLDPAY